MQFKTSPEWTNATHLLNFIGPPEGLAELRALRSGDAYEAYNSNVKDLQQSNQ